jgi:hypothetical protein
MMLTGNDINFMMRVVEKYFQKIKSKRNKKEEFSKAISSC